jgi:hypothetical protein
MNKAKLTKAVGVEIPGTFRVHDRSVRHMRCDCSRKTRDSTGGYDPYQPGIRNDTLATARQPQMTEAERRGIQPDYEYNYRNDSHGHRGGIDLTTGDGSIMNCGCPACQKRHSTTDEALESDMLNEGETLDSLAAINAHNRRKYGLKG